MRKFPPQPPSSGGHWSPGRNRVAQAHFRRLVLAAAGHQCQWTGRDISSGEVRRCVATIGLQAHHTEPGNNDPSTGVALCKAHHKATDERAR